MSSQAILLWDGRPWYKATASVAVGVCFEWGERGGEGGRGGGGGGGGGGWTYSADTGSPVVNLSI